MPNRRGLPATREAEIAELAEFVADEYCPTGVVEPEAILKAHGMTLSYGDYGDAFDGMLECENRRFHVYCNTERAALSGSGRARFTLGHELGHYFIDEHRNALLGGVDSHGSLCEYESDSLVEQEADTFSCNLLLPRGRFLAEGRKTSAGLSGILSLAGKFETSVAATSIRYVREELVPCTVIKWSPEGFGWKWSLSGDLQGGIQEDHRVQRRTTPRLGNRACVRGRSSRGRRVPSLRLHCIAVVPFRDGRQRQERDHPRGGGSSGALRAY